MCVKPIDIHGIPREMEDSNALVLGKTPVRIKTESREELLEDSGSLRTLRAEVSTSVRIQVNSE